MKSWVTLTMILVLTVSSISQNHYMKFRHITSKDGLVQNNVMAILQDSRGFMWFGTRGGLNRYDGYEFELFEHNPEDEKSMSRNDISTMYEDHEGYLWIGYFGGGLDRYNRETDSFESFDSITRSDEGMPTSNVSSVIEDKDDNLWIGTYGGGLIRLNADRDIITRIRHDENNPESLGNDGIRTLLEDSKGNIWIGFWDLAGVDKFNLKTGKFKHFKHNPDDSNSLSGNSVYVFYEDSFGNIWIGTLDGGVSRYNIETEDFTRFMYDPENPNGISAYAVRGIVEDDNGNMWFGTENGGISVYDPVNDKFDVLLSDNIDSESLNNNSIYSLYKDPEGNIWAGTFAGGVNVFFKSFNTFEHFRIRNIDNSLTHNNVTSFEQDYMGNIWVGTDGGGIDILNQDDNFFRTFMYKRNDQTTLGQDFVLDIYQDSKNNMWVGTYGGGMNLYDFESCNFKRFIADPSDTSGINNINVSILYEDSEGKLWIGTFGGGLNLFDYTSGIFSHFNNVFDGDQYISNNYVTVIAEDKYDRLWVGTNGGGLNLFQRNSKTFKQFLGLSDDISGLRSGKIFDALEDNKGDLWFGTSKGLYKLDADDLTFQSYSLGDSFSVKRVVGIEEDDRNNLWISTNNGIILFNPETGDIRKFTGSHGLQDVEFNRGASFKDRDGFIYFGGINGFNRFHPDSIEVDVDHPPVVIVDLQIFNQSVAINGEYPVLTKSVSETNRIEIPWRYSVFSLDYVALNYSFSKDIEYAYMLENFDRDWYYVGKNRKATYTNLNPGEYVFKIKCKVDGVWGEEQRKMDIIILPPFWKTFWFYAMLVFFGILILAAFFWFKTRRVRKLNRLVDERTEEIRHQNEVLERQKMQLTNINIMLKERQEKIDNQTKTLVRQQNKLKQANASKDKFLSIIAHDLRNPFSTIIGFSELLLADLESYSAEEIEIQISQIFNAALQTYNLLEDLLLWANSQSGKLTADLKEVNLNAVCAEVIDLLKNQGDRKNIEILFSDHTNNPIVTADRFMLKTIIRNLLSNAIKFTGRGGEVKVLVDTDMDKALISVADNGIGMSKKQQKHLWDISEQISGSGTENELGSGFGLLLCKEFVEKQEGEIRVESKLGKGSVFKVILPLARTSAGMLPE